MDREGWRKKGLKIKERGGRENGEGEREGERERETGREVRKVYLYITLKINHITLYRLSSKAICSRWGEGNKIVFSFD